MADTGVDNRGMGVRVVHYRSDVTVVLLSGDIDLAGVPDLRRALADADRATTVVDLSEVQILGASGVTELVDAAKRAWADGRRFGLVAADNLALRVLRLTGASPWVPTFEQLSDAVRDLCAEPAPLT